MNSNVVEDGKSPYSNSSSSPYKEMPVSNEPANNSLAIASLILGILSIFFYFFTAIPGIITGHMARSRQKKMPQAYSGKGMALTGLIFSYFMMLISIAFILGFVFIFNDPEYKEIFMDAFNEAYQQELNKTR